MRPPFLSIRGSGGCFFREVLPPLPFQRVLRSCCQLSEGADGWGCALGFNSRVSDRAATLCSCRFSSHFLLQPRDKHVWAVWVSRPLQPPLRPHRASFSFIFCLSFGGSVYAVVAFYDDQQVTQTCRVRWVYSLAVERVLMFTFPVYICWRVYRGGGWWRGPRRGGGGGSIVRHDNIFWEANTSALHFPDLITYSVLISRV